MADLHEELRRYMLTKTKGLVTLTTKETDDIIQIVQQTKEARAVLYRYDNQLMSYVQNRTHFIANDVIFDIAARYKDARPIHGFARWDLYDSTGEKIAEIFNINYIMI